MGLMVAQRMAAALSTDRSVVAPFPLHVFPEALQHLITQTAEALQCPPDNLANSILAVVSSFIGPSRPIEIKRGWIEYPVIYAVNVAETGSRKTPALDAAMAPARALDKALNADYRARLKTYKAEQKEQKKGKKESPDEPVAQQHIAVDSTIEALADIIPINPFGMLLYKDEASSWVTSLNQYKGGKGSDRQFWLSAWSCQNYTVNRKGKPPVHIPRPFLSMVGNIPPDMLGDLADRRGREDGFIDRILFVYPEPVTVKWTNTSAEERLKQAYADACFAIRKLPEAVLTMTREAQQVFALWYDEHNEPHDGPRGSWAKLDGYCARFANILHHLHFAYQNPQVLQVLKCCKGDKTSEIGQVLKCCSAVGVKNSKQKDCLTIEADTVQGAIALVDYYKDHIRRCIGLMKSAKDTNTLSRLIAFVRNAPDFKVRPRALVAARIAPDADEARYMLNRLANMQLGRIEKGKRKDEVVFIGREDIDRWVEAVESTK